MKTPSRLKHETSELSSNTRNINLARDNTVFRRLSWGRERAKKRMTKLSLMCLNERFKLALSTDLCARSGIMRKLLLAAVPAAFSLLWSVLAYGGDYVFPAKNSFARISLPDTWKASLYPKGVEAISPDQQTYFAVEPATAANVEDSMQAALDYLGTKHITVDQNTLKKDSVDIGGKKTLTFDWDGKDSNGVCKVGLAVMQVKPGKALLFIYYAALNADEDNIQDISGVLASVTPAE